MHTNCMLDLVPVLFIQELVSRSVAGNVCLHNSFLFKTNNGIMVLMGRPPTYYSIGVVALCSGLQLTWITSAKKKKQNH